MTLQKKLALVAVAAAFSAPAAAQQVTFMTGPQGGSWIPLGGQLKDMWEKAVPGMKLQVLPGAGIANVRGIQEGKADVGLANSISTADAMEGRKPFGAKPGEAQTIARVMALRAGGRTFAGIADALNAEGTRTRKRRPRAN